MGWPNKCSIFVPVYTRSHVTAKTAKTRNNYMPRLVFYPKKRLLFTQKRFFTLQNENAHRWSTHSYLPPRDPNPDDQDWENIEEILIDE
jgi:hypothetical protein